MKSRGEIVFVALGAAVVLYGCAGAQNTAPPADGAVVNAATTMGFDAAAPARGREVFIDRCGRCHTRVNPDQRTAEEWKDILPTMSRKARLSKAEAADLKAYVMGARSVADSAGAGERSPTR